MALASAAGAITSGGVRLEKADGVSGFSTVCPKLKQLDGNKAGWREPAWHEPTQFVSATKKLGVGNLLDLQAGVGHIDSPEQDLRRLRNFFAHYCASTAVKVYVLCDDLGIPRRTPPEAIPYQVVDGTTRFERWLIALEDMANLMTA